MSTQSIHVSILLLFPIKLATRVINATIFKTCMDSQNYLCTIQYVTRHSARVEVPNLLYHLRKVIICALHVSPLC